MSNVFTILFLFLTFALLLSSLRIGRSQFASFLYFTLAVVSVYAVIRTCFFSFYSFYLVGFVVWIGYKLVIKQFKFAFSIRFSDVGVALLIWSLFAVFYLDFSNFYILHPGNSLDDISVYSRIAYYNDLYGTENTGAIYNLFGQFPQIELYHHFELWMANLGHWLSGANRSMNLLLFVFPMISFLSYIGIKEFLGLSAWNSISLLLLFFLVIWPYDFANNELDFGLPKGGVGAIILGVKNVMILPIILSLIYELREGSKRFILTAISLFLYPLLIPLVSGSIVVYAFLFQRNFLKDIWMHYGLILVILGFLLSSSNSHPGLDFLGVFNLSVFPKVIFVSMLTPLLSFGVFWIFLVTKISFTRLKEFLLFFLICLMISIGFWLIFYKNIDSNQLFRNLFIPLFSFSVAGGIVFCYLKGMYKVAALAFLVFVCPIFFTLGRTTMNSPSGELKEIARYIEKDDRILFFPDPSKVNSVFMFNERMFIPMDVSMIYTFVEDIHLMNTVTLLNSQAVERNDISREMIEYYKRISPISQQCSNVEDNLGSCIWEFADRFEFKKALIHKDNPVALLFETKITFINYILVDL